MIGHRATITARIQYEAQNASATARVNDDQEERNLRTEEELVGPHNALHASQSVHSNAVLDSMSSDSHLTPGDDTKVSVYQQ